MFQFSYSQTQCSKCSKLNLHFISVFKSSFSKKKDSSGKFKHANFNILSKDNQARHVFEKKKIYLLSIHKTSFLT